MNMDHIQRVIWELGRTFAFSGEEGTWGGGGGFSREPEPLSLPEGKTVKSVFECKGKSGIKSRKQDFYDLYTSSNTIRVIKSMRSR
jgi:hypothetical protein